MGEQHDAAAHSAAPVADIEQEAKRVLDAAHAADIPLRLMGGLAIAEQSPSARKPPLAREYKDIDLVAPSSCSRRLGELLEQLGYTPDKHFNALRGDRRLFFWDEQNSRQLDVFIDRFQMCHTIDLRDRLKQQTPGSTMPLADLLLMKLQVVQITQKDMQDSAALLQDHSLSVAPDKIDVRYIASLTSKDWGLQHTLELNINRLLERADELTVPGALHNLKDQLIVLKQAMDQAPKSMGWKMRDRVGERMQWYELPEEEEH